jgi:hypothetical protein
MAIQMIRESGIYVAVDYILFDPDTSLDELKENVEFMKSANIFGHYPPLLFNRVKSYPGTLFSKTFNSDGTYFKHNAVNDIFECLQKYKDVYHKRVNKIMDIIETKIQDGQADKNMKADYIWLKMLPYNIFVMIAYRYLL